MKKTFVVHPILLALFHILFIFQHNIRYTPIQHIFMPLGIAILSTLMLMGIANLFFRNQNKAGLWTTFMVLSFFSYGHILNKIITFRLFRVIGPNDLILFCLLSFLVACTFFLVKTQKKLEGLTKFAHIFSVSLILISLSQIGVFYIKSEINYPYRKDVQNLEIVKKRTLPLGKLPNIYYIVLDGYSRTDVLQELYHYDNTEFINNLKQKGFFICTQSKANYYETLLCLASVLNFDYLDKILDIKNMNNTNDLVPLEKTIKNNRLFHFLKQIGYEIVATESGYSFTNLTNADHFLPVNKWLPNEFNSMLINTTFFSFLFNKILTQYNPLSLHYKRIQSTFDYLSNPPLSSHPQFFFAHIMSPHAFFVYEKDGENFGFQLADGSYYYAYTHETVDQYRRSYVDRIKQLNAKLIPVINRIISKPGRPSIIILQSDHGGGSEWNWDYPLQSNFKERFSILNALYLPDDKENRLYHSITSVNTFRFILNRYFGTQYTLLEDKSYFSAWNLPYKFSEWNPDQK